MLNDRTLEGDALILVIVAIIAVWIVVAVRARRRNAKLSRYIRVPKRPRREG